MPAAYFFLRPVLSADGAWAAFDWQSEYSATVRSSDYVSAFRNAGAAQLAGLMPFVATITLDQFREQALTEELDASQVYYVIPSSSLDDPAILDRCKKRRHDGYHFALELDRASIVRQVPVAAFDYVRLDAAYARQELPAADFDFINDAGFGKMATNVRSYDLASWVATKSFDYCDSHYLTTRNRSFGKEPDLTRLKLLKLLNIVKQDGDTREIEAIFREEPKLSYNLLRLVNSVAVSARMKISSFSQAIAILGRRQLQRWLQLLVYANNLADSNTPNPLMQIAAARARQMELLTLSIVPEAEAHEVSSNAFMAGLFSLLDVLINLPMQEIVRELPMHDSVVGALLSPGSEGLLARLLAAIVTAESGDLGSAAEAFRQLGVDPGLLAKTQVAAFYWASRINVEADRD